MINEIQQTYARASPYEILLVCDFQVGLVLRILDVYRYFRKAPQVILVRRTNERSSVWPQSSVRVEVVPLPVKGFESSDLASRFGAICAVIAYLTYSLVLYLRLRGRSNVIRLVHAHFIFPQGLFGLVLARLFRVPLIISAEGSDVNTIMRRNAPLRAICRFVLNRADRIIAVSIPLQRTLRRFGMVRTLYLPNSVDTATISPDSDCRKSDCILFVGSMTCNKRPLVLLRAFERVLARIDTATLVMCGDGPLLEAVRLEIQRKQLGAKVKLYPRAKPELVIQLLSQAGVFVLPSESEGLSLALLEAMAAGKVIVASSNESHNAVFRDGRGALLFRVDDDKDLADKIVTGLIDDQLRSRLSRSARELCLRKFSTKEIAPRLEMVYLRTEPGEIKTSFGW